MVDTGYCSRSGEIRVRVCGGDAPVSKGPSMEQVLERENLIAALAQVKRNQGGPGIDNMTVDELTEYLRDHWPGIRTAVLGGEYAPQAVKRVEIPKAGGGVRELGIPTVLDRFIQQALLQVLQAEWDSGFSEHSFGFRPNRSAHQAVATAQRYICKGYRWVVDMDLEKFFDRVNHDKLLHRVKERVSDWRIIKLITGFLKAGVMVGKEWRQSPEGTPQGGPLSPLLSNLMLDDLDKELERRGHCFVRYADDCNIYVRSERAGLRVLKSVTHFLKTRLRLPVNQAKSAVDRPWQRTFLGFTFTFRQGIRRKVSEKALKKFKAEIRVLTGRHRGCSIERVVKETGRYLLGWRAYFGFSEIPSPLRDLEKWVRRRLRCYLWHQWGRRGYRELRNRGVDRELAWNTAKSAHGPWRLSKSPGLFIALPNRYFEALGIPRLVVPKS